MKKLLFVSPYVFENNARGIRIAGLTSELFLNFDIHFLTFTKKIIEETIPIRNVHFLKASRLIESILKKRNRSFLDKIIGILLYRIIYPDFYKLSVKGFKEEIVKLDNIYSFNHVVLFLYPFSFFALIRKLPTSIASKTIIDIGDPFSNNAAYSTRFLKRKVRIEKASLSIARKVVVTNSKTKEYYVDYLGIDEGKVSVIQQGICKNYTSVYFMKTYRIHNMKIVYAGSFYKNLRSPKALIDSISEINSSCPGLIEFKIYGGTGYKFPASLGNDISVLRSIPIDDLIRKYHENNILLFIDNAYGIQTSGKFWELIAMGMPILFLYENDKSPLLEIAMKYKHIIICKNEFELIKPCLGRMINSEIEISKIEDCDLITWEKQSLKYLEMLS